MSKLENLKEILKKEDFREIAVTPEGKVLGRKDLGRYEEINLELSEQNQKFL